MVARVLALSALAALAAATHHPAITTDKFGSRVAQVHDFIMTPGCKVPCVCMI